MTVGGQENAPPLVSTKSGGVGLPQVVPAPWWRRRPQPRVGWITQGLFLLLLAGLAVLFLYPFVWLLGAAFKPKEESLSFSSTFPDHWHWNFTGPKHDIPYPQYLFNVAPVARWFINSFWISGLGALAVTLSSAAVAFAFAYFRFPLRNVLFGILLATMMLPGEVTMIPVYLLWNHVGKFTEAHAWLPHIGTGTQYPLWMPNLFGSAFYIFLQRQFFLGIPRD